MIDKLKQATGGSSKLSINNVPEGVEKAAGSLLETAGSLVSLGLVAFIGKRGFDVMLRRKRR